MSREEGKINGNFKRGRVYWYHFIFNTQHVQESTKQGNPRTARQMEAAHRTALAKGEVGFREKKPVPTLAEFCKQRIEPWAKATFEQSSPRLGCGIAPAYALSISTNRLRP